MMQRQDRTDAADKRTHPMVHAAEVERLQPAADNRLLQLCEAPRRTSANLLLRGYIEKSLQSCGEKRLSDARRQRLRHDRRAPMVRAFSHRNPTRSQKNQRLKLPRPQIS
jgi:hypothetical protein